MAKRNVDIAIRARDRASKKFKKISRATGGMTRAFKGAAAAAAAFFSARALTRFTKSVIQAASDTEEINSKFSAVFKELTEQADAWAISFAESVGRSNLEIKTFLATLQDTFVPLGFARDKAKEMSETMTKLAVDIASFNNKADADVIRDLQSAIVGNTETVRKYGVIITQVTLGQELLNSGMAKNVKSATEAQKSQARLNIIQRSTTDAQGDAIRTAAGYANQVKRLQANLTNLRVTIGNKILPAVNRFTTSINENFDVVSKWSVRTVDFVIKVKNAIGGQLGPVFKRSAAGIKDWAKDNRENIGTWAQKSVDFVVNVKNSLVDFAKFMKTDFTASMRLVWDNFLILMKAAFDSAVILAADGGRRAGEAFNDGLLGKEPSTPAQIEAFEAAGGETFDLEQTVRKTGGAFRGGLLNPNVRRRGEEEFQRVSGLPGAGTAGKFVRREDLGRFREARPPDIGPSAFVQARGIFNQAFSDIRNNTTTAQLASGIGQDRQTLRSQFRAVPESQRTEALLQQILAALERQNLNVPGTGGVTLRLSTAQG
jgi:hypothetical protein